MHHPLSCSVDALRRRAAVIGFVAAAAIGASLEAPLPAASAHDLAAVLSAASASVVRAEDVRWEPSRGAVLDLALGRFLLFLGSDTPEGPRDVYRARVRVTPEGRSLGVAGVYNLTATPLGDDHVLVVSGTRAAYATWAYGRHQSVTALDLSGQGAQSAHVKLADRAMAWVTNVQQTGSGEGVGRVDVTLEQPAHRVGLALVAGDAGGEALAIELSDDEGAREPTRRARLDLATGELSGEVPDGVRAEAGKYLPKRLVHWAVDTVRAVPWIGPAPIAWLEEQAFGARDAVRQALFKMRSGKAALAADADVELETPAEVLDTSEASLDLGHWPPSPIRSRWEKPEPGEGEWTPPKQPWIKRLPPTSDGEEPPSPFYETFVRPDEERPYAKVLLVAFDMRQLELGVQAGREDPKPLTGPPGAGRIPREPHIYKRVAAAFNGGFKTEHGNYGMMLDKRVLLPPVPGAATVILTTDGRVGMGSWGKNTTVGGLLGVAPEEIQSFRQNLDPLLDKDTLNPQKRRQWGFVLPGASMQTERSGICVTRAGHMMYAWGDDTNATSLGTAMRMAGCVYGMHLDMNPHHTGFLYTNIDEFKGRQYKSELLSSDMEIYTDRYILHAPKDFFYLMLRDPRPPSIGEVEWEADAGAQPAPAWMPGLFRGTVEGVELLTIEPGRASFRARIGTKEIDADTPKRRGAARDEVPPPVAKSSPPRGAELSEGDARRVLFALTLGRAGSARPRGLAVDGQVAIAPSKDPRSALLLVAEDGALSIAPSDAEIPARGEAVELPLLLREGDPVAQVVAPGRPPVALGMTREGRIYVARGDALGDVVAALESAGCVSAVLLDRGAGEPSAVFRAGTANPPLSRYEETTLYAMGKPLLPRGFRFEAAAPVELPAPKPAAPKKPKAPGKTGAPAPSSAE